MQRLTFSSLIQEGKKTFLQDDSMRGSMESDLNNLLQGLKSVRELLLGNGYPSSRAWLIAIARDGADGLRQILIKDNEEQAERLNLPQHIRAQWKRTATIDVPTAMWGEADALRFSIARSMDGLPFLRFDSFGFTEEAGLVVDEEAARTSIINACRFEITDSFKKEARVLRDFSQKVREFELTGLNALELIGKYARDLDRAADDFTVYNDLVTRRHSPGEIAVDLTPVIMAGLHSK